MTNEQNSLIARRLAGYEVQVSPAGKYYIVTDDGTRPLPDFEVDAAETLSTVEALCKSRDWVLSMERWQCGYLACIQHWTSSLPTITYALAHCLLQIAESEDEKTQDSQRLRLN